MENLTRLRRAEEQLAQASIGVVTPDRTCRRSCVRAKAPGGPYIWVFRSDGGANGFTF